MASPPHTPDEPPDLREQTGGEGLCFHDGPLEEEHLGFYYVVTIKCTRCGLIDYRFYKEAP